MQMEQKSRFGKGESNMSNKKDKVVATACPKCRNTIFYLVVDYELEKDNFLQPVLLYRCSKCLYDLDEDGVLVNMTRSKQ